MRPLIEEGYIYLAMAPLYKVTKGKDSFYLLDDSQLNEYRSKHSGEKYDVTYMKGLGEMDEDELKNTTMDVEKRRLKQVDLKDIKQMALVLNKLMGASVAPRKEFIENNAYKANIDI